MWQNLDGILLGLAIGSFCRFFDIPLPAPPKIVGALLVLTMTLGFYVGQSSQFHNLIAITAAQIRQMN